MSLKLRIFRSMAYTLSQLERLERAIASGVLRVEHLGEVTVYQSLADMIKLRDQIKAELGVETPSTARGKAWKPLSSSGL